MTVSEKNASISKKLLPNSVDVFGYEHTNETSDVHPLIRSTDYYKESPDRFENVYSNRFCNAFAQLATEMENRKLISSAAYMIGTYLPLVRETLGFKTSFILAIQNGFPELAVQNFSEAQSKIFAGMISSHEADHNNHEIFKAIDPDQNKYYSDKKFFKIRTKGNGELNLASLTFKEASKEASNSRENPEFTSIPIKVGISEIEKVKESLYKKHGSNKDLIEIKRKTLYSTEYSKDEPIAEITAAIVASKSDLLANSTHISIRTPDAKSLRNPVAFYERVLRAAISEIMMNRENNDLSFYTSPIKEIRINGQLDVNFLEDLRLSMNQSNHKSLGNETQEAADLIVNQSDTAVVSNTKKKSPALG